MADQAIDISVSMQAITCGQCGGSYAIGHRYYTKCREDGESWNCPYCQVGWGFAGRGRVQELEDKLAQQKRRGDFLQTHGQRMAEERDHEKRRAATYKGHFTRYKMRVGRGVCPCCNRTFEDLRRHMQNKHPELIESEA